MGLFRSVFLLVSLLAAVSSGQSLMSPEKRPIEMLIVESLELPAYRVGPPAR